MKNRIYLSLLTSLSCLVFLPPFLSHALTPPNHNQIAQSIAEPNYPSDIKQIAQGITVKIMVGNTNGSGVIIAKNDNTYTVITNAYVTKKLHIIIFKRQMAKPIKEN